MRLVNAVVPLDKIDEEADKWCNEILEKSPTCILMLKATFDKEFDYMRYDEACDWSDQIFPNFMNSDEQKEAQNAFFGKRKPNFLQFREKEYDEYLKTRKKVIKK